MTKLLKERWMKLAGVLTESECAMDECGMAEDLRDEDHDDDDADNGLDWDGEDDFSYGDDEDRDFVPGASAYGHSGHWDEHFDDDRESGVEMENKSLRQLKDEGFSNEEILDILNRV